MKALSIEVAGHPPKCLTAANLNCGVVRMAWDAMRQHDGPVAQLHGHVNCPKCGLLVAAGPYPTPKVALQ